MNTYLHEWLVVYQNENGNFRRVVYAHSFIEATDQAIVFMANGQEITSIVRQDK